MGHNGIEHVNEIRFLTAGIFFSHLFAILKSTIKSTGETSSVIVQQPLHRKKVLKLE